MERDTVADGTRGTDHGRATPATPAERGRMTARCASIAAAIALVDWVSKALIQRFMDPYQQVDVIGEYVRLTYIFNPGAAFGIHLGDASRLVFLLLSVTALVALVTMFHLTPAHNSRRLTAIALIVGGAVGNLLDRVRHAHGVVDFLDVGIGGVRWPVFNVADVAVTAGAVLLAMTLWRDDRSGEVG
ncbi:MAG: signal peptidase II [Gemmatimonadota bacterium]